MRWRSQFELNRQLGQLTLYMFSIFIFILFSLLLHKERFNRKIDLTRDLSHTLSKETVNVISKLREQAQASSQSLQVLVYVKDPEIQRNIQRLLYLYQEAGASFDLEFLDPTIHSLRARLDKITTPYSMVLKWDGEESVLHQVNEESLTNSILYLLKKTRAKSVCFTSSNGEPSLMDESPQGMKILAERLKNFRYEVLAIPSSSNAENLFEQCMILVVASPQFNLPISDIKIFKDYLDRGRSMLVMVDAMRPTDTLNSFLSLYGLEYSNDFIILRSEDKRAALFGHNTAIIDSLDKDHPITKAFLQNGFKVLQVAESRSLRLVSRPQEQADERGVEDPVRVKILARTSASNVQIPEVYTLEDLNMVETKDLGHAPLPFFALAEKKNMRLAVFGSAQMILNQGFNRRNSSEIILNTISYLTRDEDYIALNPKAEDSSLFKIESRSDLYLLLFLCFAYPFLYLFMGASFLFFRKKYR
ncbi:MAG: Gldg family protein [Oligoflexales bacterium]|nr:Gldg family protein [Oligoflexales bacterium]